MTANDRYIGRVFDGRYQIISRLGTGGMAAVYLAEDRELGRRVAIKILDDRHAHDKGFIERFRREAQSAAGLSHPNIVAIYDRGEAEGVAYIAMEYLDGPTLKELIQKQGPLPIPVAVDYARQILAAVGFAHRNGIVHRDIKPHNVLVGEDGRCKVTDFGIARSSSSEMTEVGSIVGTAQYLSPEQARGGPISPASDLYSVGVVLYEMLTGTVPFAGDQPLEIAMKHLSGVPAPPSAHRRGIPRELDQIVLRALAKTPAERYRSAEAFDAELAGFARGSAPSGETEAAATALLSGVTSAVPSDTAIVPPDQATKVTQSGGGAYYGYSGDRKGDKRRRRRVWPWLLGAVLLAVIGAAAYFGYTKIEDRINQNSPATVPFVEGLREQQATQKITEAKLTPDVARVPDQKVPATYVISQDPPAGEKITKGNTVRIRVSTGLPKAVVPNVKGLKEGDAVAALKDARLQPQVFVIESDKPAGRVMAQDPKAGTRVQQGTKVRVNVSHGPKPVGVPSVAGLTFDDASKVLQDHGFVVGRSDVDSNEPQGNVVGSLPNEGTELRPGQRVTLLVSKGPQAVLVPDVNGLDRSDALVTLKTAGLDPIVVMQDTLDPTADGVVLQQAPTALQQVQPGSVVTITVGRLAQPGQSTDTTATTTLPPTTSTSPGTPPATTTAPLG